MGRTTLGACCVVVALLCAACWNTSSPDTRAAESTEARTDPVEETETLFTEVADEAGLDQTQSDLDLFGYDNVTSGAAVADVDADGDYDIFLPRVGKPNSLYLNDGSGSFVDVAVQAGVAGPTERLGSATAAFADFDADGHLDLLVAGAQRGANELFMNNGDGTFSEQSRSRGAVWPALDEDDLASHIHDVAVADVNGDGHMDVLVLQWYLSMIGRGVSEAVRDALGDDAAPDEGSVLCAQVAAIREAGFPKDPDAADTRSKLLINDGTGNFRDATEEYDLPLDEIMALTGVFTDLDGDGWQDLAIAGDNCTSRLFRNDGGTRFEDVTQSAGVGTDENGMGSVVRDINRDGRPDWFITSVSYPTEDGVCLRATHQIGCSGNRMYINNGDFTFSDRTDGYGLRDGGWGWGAAIEDFANDGSLEVTMANGYDEDEDLNPSPDPDYWPTFLNDPTKFWVWDGSTYRDMAEELGIDDTTVGHALVPFDMDSDGDLDLLIVPSNDTPRLYRNNTDGARHWLTIKLSDPNTPGNAWADGAVIGVVPTEGDTPVTGWVTTGGSYESQKPPAFHVGLGDLAGTVHRVEIRWPHDPIPQVLTDVPVDQVLEVTRPVAP